MITDKDKAELDAHYKACEEAAFQASVEYQATQPLIAEIASLKAELADLRLANLCHIDEKHLAQNERDALKAKINGARAKLVLAQQANLNTHDLKIGYRALRDGVDAALEHLTQ